VPAGEPDADTTPAGPRWACYLGPLICVVGLGASIYLTVAHYDEHVSLSCPATASINCAKVTRSPQSVIAGVPVAVLGLPFFLGMLALYSPWAWRLRSQLPGYLRLAGVSTGMVFVLYLVYVELFKINAICLWCTSVHVLTFVLFVVTLLAQASPARGATTG